MRLRSIIFRVVLLLGSIGATASVVTSSQHQTKWLQAQVKNPAPVAEVGGSNPIAQALTEGERTLALGNERLGLGIGEADEENVADTKGERIARLIIYWVGFGIFIDLAIFLAGYNRSNESHDEFHAALMLLTFLSAAGMDIWFVAREHQRFFTGSQLHDIYFILICAVNLYALPQLGRPE